MLNISIRDLSILCIFRSPQRHRSPKSDARRATRERHSTRPPPGARFAADVAGAVALLTSEGPIRGPAPDPGHECAHVLRAGTIDRAALAAEELAIAAVSVVQGVLTARVAKEIPYRMSCISRVAFGGGNPGRSRHVQPTAHPGDLDSGKVVHGWLRPRAWRS